MDDVPVVDHVAVLAAGMRPTTAQRHQRRRAEKAVDLLEGEPAGRGDGDDRLLVIRRAVRRQRLQDRALKIQPLAVASIAPADDLVDEAALPFERVEIARPAQQQRVLDRLPSWPAAR